MFTIRTSFDALLALLSPSSTPLPPPPGPPLASDSADAFPVSDRALEAELAALRLYLDEDEGVLDAEDAFDFGCFQADEDPGI